MEVVIDIFFLLILFLILVHDNWVLLFLFLLRLLQRVLINVCRLRLCWLIRIGIHLDFFISIFLRRGSLSQYLFIVTHCRIKVYHYSLIMRRFFVTLYRRYHMLFNSYIQDLVDDIPWVLDITTHNFLAWFAQIANGLRRICALLTYILEVDINTELFSKTRIFIHAIRVHHMSL